MRQRLRSNVKMPHSEGKLRWLGLALVLFCLVVPAAVLAQTAPDIDQVVFSVKDLAHSETIYTSVIGFQVVSRGEGASPALQRLWDLPPGTGVKWVLLEKPGAPGSIQIRLVQFSPESPRSRYEYREQDAGFADIHICSQDVLSAYKLLTDQGFTAMHEPTPWRGGAGQAGDTGVGSRAWFEAFMHGPDGEGVTFIPGAVFGNFGNSSDCSVPKSSSFSPIRSITISVTSIAEAHEFYVNVLGWEEGVIKRYEAFGPDMETMLRLPTGTVARAMFLNRPQNKTVPWLSISEFAGAAKINLYDRNKPPYRGLVVVAFRTNDLDGLYDRMRAANVKIVEPPVAVSDNPYGGTRAFSVRGPDGAFIELVERKSTSK